MLSELLEMSDIDLDKEGVSFLECHLAYVLEANDAVRLTAIVEREEAERLHIIDSLLALPELVVAPPGPLLDIGSGGGYPGIPLAIASGRETDILDSVQKKARIIQIFLSEKQKEHDESIPHIQSLGLRAEELALERPAYYAAVVARAVASLPALVELATPLLRMGGPLIALKGRRDAEEVERGVKAAQKLGMQLKSERQYLLPVGGEKRSIVVFERIATAERELPRRPGKAQSRPLA